jgi:asparagine synthase (glutamine-hydrolysing)
MLDAIVHRGPDGWGSFSATRGASRVVLGHRRLAIIDPNGSRQPMRDPAAGLALTFNGEIYNFRELRRQLESHGYTFERDSDTEVLLRAYQHWGTSVAEHLQGQFAFAVWDERNERLFLARDRFGEKPLYLYESNGALYFASEIKALLKAPVSRPAVDVGAMWDYLAYRYVPGPRTLFEGIRKLQPATSLTWERGRITETRYWTSPDRFAFRNKSKLGKDEAVAEFARRLEDTVRMEMVSDVPFGAFLSGGLDSSSIVALMSRCGSKIKTFSVGFAEDRYSELSHAGQIARQFGTEHHEMVVSHRDLIKHLPRLVAHRDAPVSEPSDIPIYMLACEASRTVKMVLTGEGSDEILGGYRKHVAETMGWMVRGIPGGLRRGLLAPLVQGLPRRYRELKIAAASLSIDDRRERYVRWFGALDGAQRRELSVLQGEAEVRGDLPPFDAEPGNSALRSVLYFDQTSWLPDNLLERGDRMSMAASIEARVPFLDHKLAEFVSTLPDEMRVNGLTTKRVLREAAKGFLPANILERPKVGFRVPVHEWFAGEMRDYLFDHLRSASSLTRGYYDRTVLDRVLDEHIYGRQTHDKLLWALLTLEIWYRQYGRSAAPEERLACAA